MCFLEAGWLQMFLFSSEFIFYLDYLYCNKVSTPHLLIIVESEITMAAVAKASATMQVGAMIVALTILFTAGRPVRGSIV
jgi:hypothetical protein